jgi:hypothetical protein
MLQLPSLRLKKMIALFEGSQARSGYLTLAGQPHSANYRVYLREIEWHFRARNPGHYKDDVSYLRETAQVLHLAALSLLMS